MSIGRTGTRSMRCVRPAWRNASRMAATIAGVDERLEVPRILPPAPDFVDLHDAKILIADDVADTGHTLRSVELFCEGKVGDVRTCVIYEKSHSVVKCDYVWRRTDMWINFPWSDKPPVAKRDWSVADA